MLGDDDDINKIDEIIESLKMAGIHSAKCPEGIRNYHQRHTEMYISHKKCECWVGVDTSSDVVLD